MRGSRSTTSRRSVAHTLKSAGGRMAAIQQIVDGLSTGRLDDGVARAMLYAISIGTDISP